MNEDRLESEQLDLNAFLQLMYEQNSEQDDVQRLEAIAATNAAVPADSTPEQAGTVTDPGSLAGDGATPAPIGQK